MFQVKVKLFFFLFILPFVLCAQNTLTIVVEGVTSSDGFIGVALYTDKESFLKEGKEFDGAFAKAEIGTTQIEIKNVPNGGYAISIFHDENGNKALDTNFLGIPKESLGFSIGKLKTFGPPSFEECKFVIEGDYSITIPFD